MIPHNTIISSVEKEIRCSQTIRLIRKMLECGSYNPKTKVRTPLNIGTPLGNVASPTLANIVLDKLDKFMQKNKDRFETGKSRMLNKEYLALRNRRSYTKDADEKKRLWIKMRSISATNRYDPNFKRMLFIRYADDFVILMRGNLEEANRMKRHVKDFLMKHTGLELNDEKTLVTSTRKPFNFLGATCKRVINMGRMTTLKGPIMKGTITKTTTPRMRIDIPVRTLMDKFIKNKFCWRADSPTARKDLINLDHDDILAFYNSKIIGLTTFYNFARNFPAMHRFIWLLKGSCALTLALKFKLRTMRKAFTTFGEKLKSENGVELKAPDNFKQILKFDVKEAGRNLDPLGGS